jgi:hypothetical protein
MRIAAAAAPFLALILWTLPFDGHACSVCQPGDPIFSGEGASAQTQGSFTVYLEASQSWKQSGALPHHDEGPHHDEHEASGDDSEENYTRETVLFASWTPLDRLTLTARVPYRWILIKEQPFAARSQTFRNYGLGDVSMFATVQIWRNRPILPSNWIEGRLMLKAPTGTDEDAIDGERDPHLQLGTGSWDWGLGLASGHKLERASINASVFYRVNSEGGFDYEYGDVFLANLAVTSDAQHAGGLLGGELLANLGLRGGAEFNFRLAEKDDFRGQRYRHSGGTIFYLSPFVELPVGEFENENSPWIRLSARLPLGNGGLNGQQREGYVFSVGVRLGF